MRIGLIADIHGNAFALRAVLDALDRLRLDATYCLGDIATPGPWPLEVIELLAEREIPSVMGNTDQWLLADIENVVSDNPAMNDISHWASRVLGEEKLAAIDNLPMHRLVDVDETTLALFHGSPASTGEVFSELTPGVEIVQALATFGATIGIGGHTHVQMVRDLGIMLMVNSGSVGLGGTGPGTPDLPPNTPATSADFAVLEIANGVVDTELYHVDLDVQRMLRDAAATDMPHLDWWQTLWASPN